MTQAERAYQVALRRIKKAAEKQATELYLNIDDLDRLPPEIANLTALKSLYLANTEVSDLAHIASLTALETLGLSHTQVSDLAHIASLTALEILNLRNTQVSDLRPVLKCRNLISTEEDRGLYFYGSLATQVDPELDRLSQITDINDRTQQTFAYLETLPPYPDPLPWEKEIEQVGIPRLVLTKDQRIDVPTLDADHDPVTIKSYKRLQREIPKLQRFTNYNIELSPIYESLLPLTSMPIEDADLFTLHLDIAELEELRRKDETADPREKFDDDCTGVIDAILRVAPPITMGHAEVIEFEARQRNYKDQQITKAEKDAELSIIRDMANTPQLFTDRADALANRLSTPTTSNRIQTAQSSFARNASIVLSILATEFTNAATGYVATEAVTMAAQFVANHAREILAIAPTWSMNGLAWAESILRQVQHFLENRD